MKNRTDLELRARLMETGLVVPVSSIVKGGHAEILCRQVPGKERDWLAFMNRLLVQAETKNVQLHVCRRYVLKDRKMVFGWHFQIDSASAKGLVEDATALFAEAPEAPAGEDPEPAVAPEYRSPYKTDAEVLQETGLGSRNPDGGKLGRRVNPEPPLTPTSPGVVKITSRSQEEDGSERIEMTMPIPHMKRDLNVPTEGGRGAQLPKHFVHPAQRRR